MSAPPRPGPTPVGSADPVGEPPTGLTTEEAAQRLLSEGPNSLERSVARPAWKQLVRQLLHFFALLLWAAAALALVAGMPALGIAIAVVVVVNGTFAFLQERRAEHAAERLRALLPMAVSVVRGGQRVRVPAVDVVRGDLVLLDAGDRVPADLRVVRADSLGVDESMLTGESVPVAPIAGDLLWAGTHVVAGNTTALAVSTGPRTRLASISALTETADRPPSPLARELDRLVRTIALLAVTVGLGFFAGAVALGTPATDGFLFAVGVTVALVPEGLLPTVTLSLAMGAQRMAERHALVRHLEAVETLGSASFLCTDKTGTLTRNQMSVVRAWTPEGELEVAGTGYDPEGVVTGPAAARAAFPGLAAGALACSLGRAVEREHRWVADGDPMEAAIDALSRRVGAAPLPTARRWFAFDATRRRASAVVADRLFVKGAPDAVLPRCSGDTASAAHAVEDLAAAGLRVLAVARRDLRGVEPADEDDAERDLELLGLLGFLDPPRDGITEAVAACRRAGVRLAMLTGDHPTTARAIAERIGFLGPEGIVLNGADLPKADDALGAALDHDGVVVSRVDPEAKLRVARALRARGHVVAMTGDGVNDGPALREADIGVAMGGSGTDVAREAADLVLLDDDFATIVTAIEQGRATFVNIGRFLTYHLTDNVAELAPFVLWVLSGGSFPLAIGVLQILCLDIGTDLLPALALGAEPAGPHALEQTLRGRHLVDRRLLLRALCVLGPVEAACALLAFAATLAAGGWSVGQTAPGPLLLAASGAAFSAVVLGQCANAFACRSSTLAAWRIGRPNPLLRRAVVVEFVALGGFLFLPVNQILEHRGPTTLGGALATLTVPAVLVTDAAHKHLRRRWRGDAASTRTAGAGGGGRHE